MENELQLCVCDSVDKYKRVRLNVSGTIFETYRGTLTRKEGSIFNLDNIRNYYDPLRNEYYFDRNPKAFEAIFVFMQCGILSQPIKVPDKVFIEELQFFGFGQKALKIFHERIETRIKEKKDNEPYASRNSILGKIWDILEHPESSVCSKAVASFSIFVIVLAVCLFSFETLPDLRGTKAVVVIKHMEYFCVSWFTLEIMLRFASCPTKSRFFMNAMNVIDIFSLIPYHVELFLISKTYSKALLSSIRILRVARIFNLFRLYRYSRAIRLMAKTLYSSIAELSMLLFFVGIGTMMFSPLLYYFEFDTYPGDDFQSIPRVFWLCIVTTTTVGYGDVVPMTTGGRLAASMLSVLSIILVTLPVPIIGRNFMIVYEEFFGEEKAGKMHTFDPEKSREVEREELVERETIL